MNRKIKLIWDFYGADAEKTAEHHVIHLKEFADQRTIELIDSGVDNSQQELASAYIVVEETHMLLIRDTLRPKRGQWVD